MNRNVLFVCLDTVRADLFEETASAIPEMADVAVAGARAPSSCTVPSHASLVSGRLPSDHGVYSFDADMRHLDTAETLFDSLSDYRTVGVSANPYAGSASHFDTFFDEFADISPQRRFPDGMDAGTFALTNDTDGPLRYVEFLRGALSHDAPLASLANGVTGLLNDRFLGSDRFPRPFDNGAKYVLREARRRLREGDDRPTFLYLNLMEAHEPVADTLGQDVDRSVVPRGWSSDVLEFDAINAERAPFDGGAVETYRHLYRSAIEYMDRLVADFVRFAEETLSGETTTIVFSDHGERLGYTPDDRQLGHNMSRLTESLLHVPLLIRNPPVDLSHLSEELVSLLDLPSLVSSVVSEEQMGQPRRPVVAERLASVVAEKFDVGPAERARLNQTRRCVYDDGQKVVWDGERSVTVVEPTDDLREVVSEASAEVPDAETDVFEMSIETADRRFDTEGGVGAGVDEATQERLEQLGYS